MRRHTVRPSEPAAASWWSRRPVWLLVLVIVLGLCTTAMAAAAFRHADEERVSRALTQQTSLVSTLVNGEIRRYTGFLEDLAAALGAQARVEAAEFAAATAQVDRRRLPGASGISLVVPATAEQIPPVQAYWRDRGVTGLTLRRAGAAPEHQFVVLSRSLGGAASTVGRDLSASPEASEALRLARETGRVAASRTYRLLRDALLPIEQQQLSFVFAAPIKALSPGAEDAGEFRGWLIMGLRGDDFLRQTIGLAAGDSVAVSLSDGTARDSTPVAAWRPAPPVDTGTAARYVTVPASQRSWQLAVHPTTRLLPDTDLHRDVIAALIGVTITCLLAVLTRTVLNSRERAWREVATATAALREDITRREEVEAQLRHREAELKGFAGVVAHDLRNPLARITGYADVLRELVTLPPQEQMFLDRLQSGARQMQILIDDLLDYATADNRDLERMSVDLDTLVGRIVLDRVEPGSSPEITVGPLPTVEGDPTLLRQVFDNLIGNALKYIPPGTAPRVRVSAGPADDHGWRIEVRDNGIGIPAAQRAAVFDAFVRAPGSTTYPGTGLGLAIVHRIVERHGGTVGVEDNPGGGCCFWLTLPGDRPPEAVSEQREHALPRH